ncbi:hypothetical protein D9M72_609650 [compost metagenome]
MVATAVAAIRVPPSEPPEKAGMMPASRLRTLTRMALNGSPSAASNTCIPDASARPESQTLHSTVMSAFVNESKRPGTLRSAEMRPAVTACAQSAAAPRPSTWTADRAARSAPFCISRFM